MSESQPAPAPVACRLSPVEMASRRQLWEEVAEVALVEKRPTPRGALLRFRALPGVAERLRRLAELEKDCCGFATFTVTGAEDRVLLEVESSGEGVEAVRRMFEVCP
jgi:hypothetical protein